MSKKLRAIFEAQEEVDRWLSVLINLDTNDPRFDGAHEAYSASIDKRNQAEKDYRRAR